MPIWGIVIVLGGWAYVVRIPINLIAVNLIAGEDCLFGSILICFITLNNYL